ncbi:hypothetical protein A3Q56_02971 [Intoshia linei]|uniref:RRM domain-containing protein n=1 Tax=Intoshia linei TaxID=1819745 RepID=A0A177B4W4_9BILA|nr:hypothetical protein A3Q56_02971 [Intoshia linei]
MAKTPTNVRNVNFPFMEMTSLYVGDLHKNVTEEDLTQIFRQHGEIISVRLVLHVLSRKSLGYGYINYKHYNDAEQAKKELSYTNLKGKSMRIMWNMRDPTQRRSTAGNIFIKNLGKSIDQKTLFDTFSEFGNILSCKIVTDEDGVSKGFGFVHFENPKHANTAITKINGCSLNIEGTGGKPVYVALYKPRNERQNQKYDNLYIKNFDTTWDDCTLRTLFSEFGEILSAKVMVNSSDGTSRCFGFVSFKNSDDAMRARNEMNDKEITLGETMTKLYVSKAQKKSERERELANLNKRNINREKKNVNLYIKHLDDSITDEMLKDAFEKFGQITSCKVMTDDNNRSRGFGFVCYADENSAKEAANKMINHILVSKPLYVAMAQTKEERKHFFARNQGYRGFNNMHMYGVNNGYPMNQSMIANPSLALGNGMRGSHPLSSYQYRNNMQPGYIKGFTGTQMMANNAVRPMNTAYSMYINQSQYNQFLQSRQSNMMAQSQVYMQSKNIVSNDMPSEQMKMLSAFNDCHGDEHKKDLVGQYILHKLRSNPRLSGDIGRCKDIAASILNNDSDMKPTDHWRNLFDENYYNNRMKKCFS